MHSGQVHSSTSLYPANPTEKTTATISKEKLIESLALLPVSFWDS